MMTSTIPPHFKFKVWNNHPHPNTHLDVIAVRPTRTRRSPTASFCSTHQHHLLHHHIFNHKSSSIRTVLTRVSGDGGGIVDAASQQSASADRNTINSSSPSLGDGYVALFVRMLGLDNDPLDREQAVVALWKYSLGGKQYIDAIMQFRGCLNLTVNLLKSDSSSTCEAAAGLLREIASINLYRESVAESGAIEEITGLLRHSSLTSE